MGQFRYLLVKLGALFSFCGGPLILCEMLKPRIGTTMAFVVTFAPILFMIFSADSLFEGPWRPPATPGSQPKKGVQWGIVFMHFALAGALVTLLMHAYGAWILASPPPRPDRGLNLFGLVVGIPIAVAYIYFARRWLERATTPDDPFAPIEPK